MFNNLNSTKMKTTIKMLVLVIALTGIITFGANAQNKAKVSLEIDPVTFAFSGYSAHVRIQPKSSEKVLLGAGIYAMNMPSAIVNFNENNKDLGWNVRLSQGYGLFGEYHFDKPKKKWFLGAQTSLQQYTIEKDNETGESKFNNALLMAYGGYAFQLFNSNLYAKPWAGVGYTAKLSGENTLGNSTYDIAPITMFATLHIGYTF